MAIDATLNGMSMMDSLLQAVMICGMLGFVIWNVKLCFENVD